ncbi:hypothetical protein HS088_TW06G00400 [Tripterygium wilfordii]|uniref:SMAD/FHA domain-containing protein n=1 Tax=Tripterygium wilfordii TaxID=458696 RepID=A0A7J7DIQ8_TRIWF|nr:uncharacterized protein LOC120000513 [Tripterygium wilfordii]XP_038704571.1 uncharacterized protein LOC120000528 [Tripterygium wilfordii]KAF5746211.1 hypothetical protein HS088_TW06G00378 [Tripterygium wilfordii]KAF5746231.1 hypothetical protein HS088_TW06G00400 [Tripterygium wilfordii]
MNHKTRERKVMEIEGEDGSKMKLQNGTETVFGRGSGFETNDRAVSRRHILFELKIPADETDIQTGTRVLCQVFGKNPIFVRRGEGGEIEVLRRFESAEIAAGDWFCVSSRDPLRFTLKRIEGQQNKDSVSEDESSERFEEIDVSKIDPVQEFGFLVIGHEFDCYPKNRIRDAKNWKWFLEGSRQDSDDEDGGGSLEGKDRIGGRRKRKKSQGNEDDDEWTGESEDDNDVATLRKVGRLKYSTRSKDHDKPSKGAK